MKVKITKTEPATPKIISVGKAVTDWHSGAFRDQDGRTYIFYPVPRICIVVNVSGQMEPRQYMNMEGLWYNTLTAITLDEMEIKYSERILK
jgi:hypothetical protein